LLISDTAVEVEEILRFLRVHITDRLTWSQNTASLVKRVQLLLHVLCRMTQPPLSHPHRLLQEYDREHHDYLNLSGVAAAQLQSGRTYRT